MCTTVDLPIIHRNCDLPWLFSAVFCRVQSHRTAALRAMNGSGTKVELTRETPAFFLGGTMDYFDLFCGISPDFIWIHGISWDLYGFEGYMSWDFHGIYVAFHRIYTEFHGISCASISFSLIGRRVSCECLGISDSRNCPPVWDLLLLQ